MKITDVRTLLLSAPIPPERRWRSDFGSSVKTDAAIVVVETDAGITGYGEAKGSPLVIRAIVAERLKPALLGQDPTRVEYLWERLYSGSRTGLALKYGRPYHGHNIRGETMCAISGVDVALWDIAGKVAGLPIHRLLGTCREKAPAYASSAVMASPDDYVQEALSFREKGWTAYKIHPPRRWKEDIAVCEAVKKAVGDTMLLMLDSTWSYGYEEALRVGLAIQDMGYYWCAPLRRSA